MASLRKLRKAAKKNPRDAAAWFELGVGALEAGERQEAHEALRIALALVPPAPIAISLGRIFKELGQPGESLRAFRRAAELEPHSVEACTFFGQALLDAGDQEHGLQQLQRAADLTFDSAEPHYQLAKHLLQAGRREHAVAALRNAISIVSAHQPSLALLGRCLRDDGVFEEARSVLEKAVALNPNDVFARVDLGVVLAKTGQKDAAFRTFREVLNRSGNSAEVLVKVGLATYQTGDLATAIRYLRDAVRIKPTLVEAHTQLGLLLVEEGSLGAATVALARAVELAPTSHTALYHLGVAYERYGDLAESERAFTEASVLAPDDEEIRARLHEVQAAQAAQLAAKSAAPEPSAPRSNAAMVGSLEDFALPELLQLLRGARRSGILYLSAGELTGEVTLLDGAITSASSPRSGLGDILMGEHGVTDDQLREVIGLQREGNNRPLGALLVERGILNLEQLNKAVETQVKAAIAEIVTWSEGRFAFEPQKNEPEGSETMPRLDVDRVLLDVLT